jgi:hypothetical protein
MWWGRRAVGSGEDRVLVWHIVDVRVIILFLFVEISQQILVMIDSFPTPL